MLPAVIAGGAALAGAGLQAYGASQSSKAAADAAAANIAYQREFAQKGIQWKVADAQAAGIHPLYALGAQTHSFAPVSVGDQGAGFRAAGAGLVQAGQDVSRAMMAGQTVDQRLGTLMSAAAVENQTLRNDLLKLQIAKLTGQVGPAIPSQEAVDNVFPIGETGKSSGMPPLMMAAHRWMTDPGISSMKDFEDRYGDEGPVAALMPLVILSQDLEKNYGPIQNWPAKLVSGGYEYLKSDVIRELNNLRRMIGGR